MKMTTLNDLPEELLLLIIEFLDAPSPSSRKLRQEPSLELTSSGDCTLKNISLVSKPWRRLVIPTVFKYARLRLDAPANPKWAACRICNENAISKASSQCLEEISPPGCDQYHADMVAAALSQCNANLQAGQGEDEAQQMGEMAFAAKERIQPSIALAWIPRFYHAMKDFLQYLQENDLVGVVDSFVLYTGQMLEEKLHRFPHEAADKDWRFPASAAFWAHLLSIIDPTTVTILAPPTDLACLTNCAIDTFGDWAFSEMDLHVLSLTHPRSTRNAQQSPTSYPSLRPIPSTYPSIAPSSILSLRPWTHLSLNEGPFLKAYGTYEFFERGPPSLVYSIKDSLIRSQPLPESPSSPENNPPATPPPTATTTTPTRPLSSLTTLSYTAIFPFANHADFSPILHRLTTLSLQLAPTPQSNILNDRTRIGKADLADCWTELLTTYAELVEPLASTRRPSSAFASLDPAVTGEPFVWGTGREGVRVRRVEVLDFGIRMMREELDEVFVPLCLPVWMEEEGGGVFTRLE